MSSVPRLITLIDWSLLFCKVFSIKNLWLISLLINGLVSGVLHVYPNELETPAEIVGRCHPSYGRKRAPGHPNLNGVPESMDSKTGNHGTGLNTACFYSKRSGSMIQDG